MTLRLAQAPGPPLGAAGAARALCGAYLTLGRRPNK